MGQRASSEAMQDAAQREIDELEFSGMPATPATQGALALKAFAASRLAQHRNRRAAGQAQQAAAEERVAARRDSGRGVASRVREAVAARYAESPSYHEFLTQESERALERAQAEAEIAARNVRVLADAQRQLLRELESRAPARAPEATAVGRGQAAGPTPDQPLETAGQAGVRGSGVPGAGVSPTGGAESNGPELGARQAFWYPEPEPPAFRVQLADGLNVAVAAEQRRVRPGGDHFFAPAGPGPGYGPGHGQDTGQDHAQELAAQELAALDAELDFRHSEGFDGHSLALTPIPGNLIEFPRVLVAARKVRPRLAEGPLREESEAEPQLRIFEVEPEHVDVTPAAEADAAGAEWHGMVLDAPVKRIEDPLADLPFLPEEVPIPVPIEPATLERRLLSTLVDGCLIGLGFVGFVTVFVRLAPRVVRSATLPHLGLAAAAALAASWLLYQLLFFTFSEATPGMHAAHVALCTFADERPTRKALRLRLAATALAGAPLALGILWMAVDGKRLGWHDRMSGMYPREY